jgi:ABC-type transport system substrate-binding protein
MRSIRAGRDLLSPALAVAAVALLAGPVACNGALHAPLPAAGTPESAPRRGGTLHLASRLDIRNLDPAAGTDGLASQALLLLFEGLVDFDRDGQVVPSLAESWEIEDDGRTYRFHLRPGVQMQDGRELTADDVKRTFERALRPSTPNPNASTFEDLEGYEAFTAGKAPHLDGVLVESPRVVTFHLIRPDGAFLALLGMAVARPVCATAGDHYASDWLPCGAGPFKLEPGGWQKGASLRLVRHEGYFRPGLPHLDAVEWTYNMNTLPQRMRFEDGEIDLLRDVSAADYARFSADPRWRGRPVALAENQVWGEAMNTRMAPFDDVEVRRAVAAAIQREHWAMLLPANISPQSQLLPRGAPGYDPTFEGQRYDEAAALEHMRKAGHPFDPATGRGGWPDPVTYTVFDGFESSAALILQQDLARIGIRLHIRVVTWSAYLAITARQGASQMHVQGDGPDYPDPSTFFDPLFTTSAIQAEGTSNTSFYSNPRYDELVARARRMMPGPARMALYREADELLCDEAPWAFSHAQHDIVIPQPYVRGFERHPVWPFDVRRVWLDRPEGAVPAVLPGGP